MVVGVTTADEQVLGFHLGCWSSSQIPSQWPVRLLLELLMARESSQLTPAKDRVGGKALHPWVMEKLSPQGLCSLNRTDGQLLCEWLGCQPPSGFSFFPSGAPAPSSLGAWHARLAEQCWMETMKGLGYVSCPV